MHQVGVGVLGPVFRTYDPDGDRLVAVKAFQLDLVPEQVEVFVGALKRVAEVGPVARKTSSRLITILTGRPDCFDRAIASGSR